MLEVLFIKLVLDSLLCSEMLFFRFLMCLLVYCLFHKDLRLFCNLDITALIYLVALFVAVSPLILALKSHLNVR